MQLNSWPDLCGLSPLAYAWVLRLGVSDIPRGLLRPRPSCLHQPTSPARVFLDNGTSGSPSDVGYSNSQTTELQCQLLPQPRDAECLTKPVFPTSFISFAQLHPKLYFLFLLIYQNVLCPNTVPNADPDRNPKPILHSLPQAFRIS